MAIGNRVSVFGSKKVTIGPDFKNVILVFMFFVSTGAVFDSIILPVLWVTSNYYCLACLFVACLIQIFVLFYLFKACLTNPGILTPSEKDNPNKPDASFNSSMQTSISHDVVVGSFPAKIKHCSTCQIYRPLRSSHCSSCDVCVDGFDHHCPYLSTCIGKRNYRSFFLFLLFSVFHVFSLLGITTYTIVGYYSGDYLGYPKIPSALQNYTAIVMLTLTVGTGWFVVGLFGYHCYLRSRNLTTYESIKGQWDLFNIFDRGCAKNFQAAICDKSPEIV
jgi:palmitoyltransferase ZDHHC9/14/18